MFFKGTILIRYTDTFNKIEYRDAIVYCVKKLTTKQVNDKNHGTIAVS